MRVLWAFICVLVPCFLHCKDASMKEFENYVQSSMKFWNVPGCAIAIVKDGNTLLSKGFGVKQLNKPAKNNSVDEQTIFPIASLTKPFTAFAIGILIDRKQMGWNDPIVKYFTEFQLNDSYAKNHLSIADCLSMHSGLVNPTLQEITELSEGNYSQDELIQKLPNIPFKIGFRASFGYQNLLYLLIAKVIEKTQNMSWSTFVQKNILSPLEMNHTLTSYQDLLKQGNKAYPYQWADKKNIRQINFENLDNLDAAAGIYSNAQDMSKWLTMLTSNGKGIVKPDTLQAILNPQAVANATGFFTIENLHLQEVFFPNAQFLNYSYGWFIHDYKGIKICQTPGLTDGMNALMIYVPRFNLGIVILNNLEAPFFSHSVAFQLIDTYLNNKTDWNAKLLDILKSS